MEACPLRARGVAMGGLALGVASGRPASGRRRAAGHNDSDCAQAYARGAAGLLVFSGAPTSARLGAVGAADGASGADLGPAEAWLAQRIEAAERQLFGCWALGGRW